MQNSEHLSIDLVVYLNFAQSVLSNLLGDHCAQLKITCILETTLNQTSIPLAILFQVFVLVNIILELLHFTLFLWWYLTLTLVSA